MEAGPAKEAIVRGAVELGTVCSMVLSTDALFETCSSFFNK